MRLLHVLPTADPAYGGPVTWVYDVSKVLEERGHTVKVITADAPDHPSVVSAPVSTLGLGPGKSSYRYCPAVGKWVTEHHEEFDAVMLHGLWEHPFLSAGKAMRRLKRPYFAMTHGMLDRYFNDRFPAKAAKKRVFWKMGGLAEVMSSATGVLFTCVQEQEASHASFLPYKITPMIVKLGTPVEEHDPEVARAAFLGAVPAVEGGRYLLYLSRIHPKKGPEFAVEAFAKVFGDDGTAHLVMVGPDSGGLTDELRSLADASGHGERVHFPGMLRGPEKAGAFMGADAFVLPSHHENFGLVIAEALSYSVPALISDKVNIHETVVDNGAGFSDTDDLDGTVRTWEKWKQLPEDKKQAMRQASRRCYEEHFEIGVSADDIVRLVNSVSESAPSS